MASRRRASTEVVRANFATKAISSKATTSTGTRIGYTVKTRTKKITQE